MVVWPAVLTHPDDPELDYFECFKDLELSIGSGAPGIAPDLHIIDSAGQRYALTNPGAGIVNLKETGDVATLDQVLELVQKHAEQAEQCCIEKIWAPSIAEALALVRSISDE